MDLIPVGWQRRLRAAHAVHLQARSRKMQLIVQRRWAAWVGEGYCGLKSHFAANLPRAPLRSLPSWF